LHPHWDVPELQDAILHPLSFRQLPVQLHSAFPHPHPTLLVGLSAAFAGFSAENIPAMINKPAIRAIIHIFIFIPPVDLVKSC
jgi:hypothetical protein